jgi:hypothetical protein
MYVAPRFRRAARDDCISDSDAALETLYADNCRNAQYWDAAMLLFGVQSGKLQFEEEDEPPPPDRSSCPIRGTPASFTVVQKLLNIIRARGGVATSRSSASRTAAPSSSTGRRPRAKTVG